MSLRALRTLLAVARSGSLARAAETVGLTQSAVSLHVKALEDEFGVQLFDRSRRRLRFTEAGRILLARAEEVVALYDRIPEALSDERALVGRLRLGAVQSALNGPIPEALATLRRAHPGLRVYVASGLSAALAMRVAEGDLDVAVTSEPVRPHPPDLVWRTLYEDRFWLVAPPGRQDRNMTALLAELPFIRFDAQAWAGRMIAGELKRLGIDVREEMALDDQQTIIRMAANGLGVAVVALSDDVLIDLPPLTLLPFGQPQLRRRVVLLERRERPAQRFAEAFGDAVAAVSMRNSQGSDEN